MRHDPASAAVVIILRSLKMYGGIRSLITCQIAALVPLKGPARQEKHAAWTDRMKTPSCIGSKAVSPFAILEHDRDGSGAPTSQGPISRPACREKSS